MKTLHKYCISTYDPHSLAVNQRSDFTRRIPALPEKQLARDSKIFKQIFVAWDVEGNPDKVIEIFLSKAHLLSNPRYWELMRTVWIAAGSTETAHIFRKLMKSARPCRSWFMTPEDADELDGMTFPLTVWRAYDKCYTPETDPGISWTIDKEWCEEYAQKKGRIIRSRTVTREEIFAYVSRRGESEVIIL